MYEISNEVNYRTILTNEKSGIFYMYIVVNHWSILWMIEIEYLYKIIIRKKYLLWREYRNFWNFWLDKFKMSNTRKNDKINHSSKKVDQMLR